MYSQVFCTKWVSLVALTIWRFSSVNQNCHQVIVASIFRVSVEVISGMGSGLSGKVIIVPSVVGMMVPEAYVP